MDRLVYTAYSGLRSRMSAQAAIANNMANASTIGFRADRIAFEQLPLQGVGFEARTMTAGQVVDADRKAGALVGTGRALDISMQGEAWLTVQAADGEEAYTRRGDLSVSPTGMLQNGEGHLVLGEGGPVSIPPSAQVSIGPDGAVLAVLPGGSADAPQRVDRLKLVTPAGSDTVKGLDNLLRVRDGGTLPSDLDAKIVTGSLEQSNVNITDTLVQMIENQRGYELQAKLLATAKDMDDGGASVMRMP